MKKDIHPDYNYVVFRDFGTGFLFSQDQVEVRTRRLSGKMEIHIH